MRRREFITLLGGAAAAWPLGAQAQQPATVPRIGWIAIGTPQGSEFFEAVKQGLRQLGYVEGRSVIIEPRWPADIGDRVPELVRELLALNVQVIVAQGAIVPLVRRVIDSTPVVFGYSGDPVEAGLVNSFSRPGGNFTGATFMSYEVNAKRVELLREAFPHVTRVAILSNPLHPGEQRELKESEQGAETARYRAFLCSNAVGRRNRAGVRAHTCRGRRSNDRPAGWAGHAASEANH